MNGRTGITLYLTPYTDDDDIHGFAAKDGPAGDAAREQLEAFLQAWRVGEAPTIIVPSGCLPDGPCDFSE